MRSTPPPPSGRNENQTNHGAHCQHVHTTLAPLQAAVQHQHPTPLDYCCYAILLPYPRCSPARAAPLTTNPASPARFPAFSPLVLLQITPFSPLPRAVAQSRTLGALRVCARESDRGGGSGGRTHEQRDAPRARPVTRAVPRCGVRGERGQGEDWPCSIAFSASLSSGRPGSGSPMLARYHPFQNKFIFHSFYIYQYKIKINRISLLCKIPM